MNSWFNYVTELSPEFFAAMFDFMYDSYMNSMDSLLMGGEL